jgi:tetratricopeptide (TPR) repeat protein
LAPWQAGCAFLALGRDNEALAWLQAGLERGGPAEHLAYACAAWQSGQPDRARQTLAPWREAYPDLRRGPGLADFHLEAARLLRAEGRAFLPGFNAGRMPLALWTALEHLQQATGLDPENAGAWEEMGDLLQAAGTAAQASFCYQRALSVSANPGLKAKAAQAAKEGYLA